MTLLAPTVVAAEDAAPPPKADVAPAPVVPAEPPPKPREPAATESAPKKDPKKKPKLDEVQRLGSSRHLDVVARSVKLTKASRERLLAIGARFHAATGKKLVVTGGDRDPKAQARLMYQKLEHGDDLLALYARDELVKPIVAAYTAAKAERHGEKRVIRAMASVIQAQVNGGEFVSRHLELAAADVRARGMSDADVEALRAAVAAEPGAQLVDERDSVAPHWHLNL